MIGKSIAILSMVAVLGLGIALVSKAKSPTRSGGSSSAAVVASDAIFATISRGEPVTLAEHASPVGATVFEFYADW